MNRYERKNKKIEEYQGAKIKLYLDDTQPYEHDNAIYYDKLKEALETAGFHININKDNLLTLEIAISKFYNANYRSAGRKDRVAKKDGAFPYRYSDIVYMLNTMTDKEIIKELKMPQATYYRHKKAMKQSAYYTNLDKKRLNDIEYLESQPINPSF